MSTDTNYSELSIELEAIVASLNEDGIDVDEAMQKYERGLALIAQLEKYLKSAENKIEKLANLKG
ncbi:MAG: exodeoxyribonuclease VII small subunit [Candidatus Saccharimonadales bacterium]